MGTEGGYWLQEISALDYPIKALHHCITKKKIINVVAIEHQREFMCVFWWNFKLNCSKEKNVRHLDDKKFRCMFTYLHAAIILYWIYCSYCIMFIITETSALNEIHTTHVVMVLWGEMAVKSVRLGRQNRTASMLYRHNGIQLSII